MRSARLECFHQAAHPFVRPEKSYVGIPGSGERLSDLVETVGAAARGAVPFTTISVKADHLLQSPQECITIGRIEFEEFLESRAASSGGQ